MTEKKRGRGRPKGAPNKPVMELITERQNLTIMQTYMKYYVKQTLLQEKIQIYLYKDCKYSIKGMVQ